MRPIVLLALLAACNGDALDPSQDADGDGFSADQGDCDDGNTGIFPGATERCDGIDSDCDGEDGGDDLAGSATFYEDTDSDGYGVQSTAVQACEAPAGVWSELPGDCAPEDAMSNPGAEEVCDGVDNDCSGEADDGLPDVFADVDGDGFGDPSAALTGCETGANRVANDDDCDDSNADVTPETIWYFDTDEDGFGIDEVTAVSCTSPGGDYALEGGDCRPDDADGYPGAEEICDNGQQAQNIDDNCNGEVDEGCEALVSCDTITVDTTWSGDMVVPCDIVVEGTPMPTLTIADGTTVRFGAGRSLIIGSLDLGRLVVEGGAQGVTLSSDVAVPTAGDWAGLVLDNAPGSTLTGLTIEYAGADGAGLVLGSDDAVLTDLTLADIQGIGIQVDDGERISIGAAGDGQLVAVGTQAQPIVFTSSAAVPAAGDWTGLVVQQDQATTTLTHVEIRNTGSSNVFDAGLYISGDEASVVADNLLMVGGAGDGITVWNGTLELSNSVVSTMAGDGLVVDAFGDLTSVSSSEFSNNGGAARFANSDAVTRMASTVAFVDNNDERVRIPDMTLKRDSVWVDFGVPYLIENSLTVASESGTDLSLASGQLEFAAGAQLQIGFAGGQTGSMTASGVEFRGEGPSPGAGFWNGISVRGDVSITNSTIRHAGNAPSSPVDLFSGASIVSDNAFESILGDPVTCWIGSGPNTVTGNTVDSVPYFGCP